MSGQRYHSSSYRRHFYDIPLVDTQKTKMCHTNCLKMWCAHFICLNHFIRLNQYSVFKMPRMSVIQRAQAIGMLRAMSIRDVANHFNVHRRTIERLKNKFNQTADVTDAQRSGRPRKTNQREDRNK